MNVTGHGKGYGYDMRSEKDTAVFIGFILLILWIISIVPIMIVLCRKFYFYKRIFVFVPIAAFCMFFVIGIFAMELNEFLSFFGIY